MLFIIVFQYDYRYCIDQTTNVRFCGFDSLHPKGNQSRLQIIENPTFYSLRIELRFRTTARDIPPFLPQRLGLEWTFLDLSGLEPQASNAVFSTNLSNIKDSGIYLRSPIYGAGEGNRTLDVSLGSSSFAIKLHPHIDRFLFAHWYCNTSGGQSLLKTQIGLSFLIDTGLYW